jgi:hypothetical protein
MLTQCRILFHKEVIFRKASHVQNYVVGQPSDFITHSSKLGPHNFSYHFSIKLFQYIEKRNLLNRKTTKHLVKDRFDVENKQGHCPVLSPDVNHMRCTQTVSNKGPEGYPYDLELREMLNTDLQPDSCEDYIMQLKLQPMSIKG